jgi:hypothetical protein
MAKSGKLGTAKYETKLEADGTTMVRAWRDYPAGLQPTTAERVWQIAADFDGVKTIFPLMLGVYISYPDTLGTAVNMVRCMTFAPPDPTSPLSAKNALAFGVEQLVEIDEKARSLTYISVLGMPVENYRSTMQVTGDDACRLSWTSTFTIDPKNRKFVKILAGILVSGANQIAVTLGLG